MVGIDTNFKEIIIIQSDSEMSINHEPTTFYGVMPDLDGWFTDKVKGMGELFFLDSHIIPDNLGSGYGLDISFGLELTFSGIGSFNIGVGMTFSEFCHLIHLDLCRDCLARHTFLK